eukprot:CFRG0473T1
MATELSSMDYASIPNGPRAKETPFFEICDLFESMKNMKTGTQADCAKKYMNKWREHDINLFPLLRTMAPQYDNRGANGLKEASLADLYRDRYQLSDSDYNKLKNFKSHDGKNAGDYPSLVNEVLSKKAIPSSDRLSIADVHDLLDRLTEAYQEKSDETKRIRKEVFNTLARRASALENKYFTKLVLKDGLKVRLGKTTVLNVFHPNAVELFNSCNNLREVAYECRDRDVVPVGIGIQLMKPFTPMLTKHPAELDEVKGLFTKGGVYTSEIKFDGDRFVVHMKRPPPGSTDPTPIFKIYSRRCTEFGSLTDNSFLKRIIPCFESVEMDCIIDTELCRWDSESKCVVPRSFGGTDVKRMSVGEDRSHPIFFAFDLLYLNGRTLINEPLHRRQALLKKTIHEVEGYMQVSKVETITTFQELTKAFDAAILDRQEGIVLKNVDSLYLPALRDIKYWIKLRPEYFGEIADDIDVCIIGGYHSGGTRNKDLITHYLTGVLSSEKTASGDPIFHSFCKTGGTKKISTIKNLMMRMSAHMHKYDHANPPDFMRLSQKSSQKGNDVLPDVYINPKDANIVISVKGSQLTETDNYMTTHTLQFPRLVCVRDDKSWQDIETVTSLSKRRALNSEGLASTNTNTHGKTPMKRRKVKQDDKISSVYVSTDVSNVKVEANILKGLTFFVSSSLDEAGKRKSDIETLIKRLGGTFLQKHMNEDYAIVGKATLNSKSLIKQVEMTGECNIVHLDWLLECAEACKLLPIRPQHIRVTSKEITENTHNHYDRYGCAYNTHLMDNQETERLLMRAVDMRLTEKPDTAQDQELLNKAYCSLPDVTHGMQLFANTVAYFDRYTIIGDPCSAIDISRLPFLELQFISHGGSIATRLSCDVTHIVCDQWDLSRVPQLESNVIVNDRVRHIVSSRWITESIREGYRIQERSATFRKNKRSASNVLLRTEVPLPHDIPLPANTQSSNAISVDYVEIQP